MKYFYGHKERGATLLELLAALIIISFIVLTFSIFFTQSQLFTKNTEEKIDIVNLNQYILYEAVDFLHEGNIEEVLQNEVHNSYFSFLEQSETGYFIQGNNDQMYYPFIFVHRNEVQQEESIQSLKAYHVTVSLRDETNETISELYELIYETDLKEGLN
ncbi:hypothetical protein [Alkalicoccus daliensis]|uniref:Prepilin-type N-terminal cleavage/methylation domain-containing protein n=1 Tax=Alkalicoccus daliensis TaxID=745820 RepID=A0A1H0IAV8_9BACI|nr:hypothetical protein [Alkalicoccus daliensis]SDO28589.1 hypothetical protein SAMN04488053_11074 [Alkalicoccus daliensis]